MEEIQAVLEHIQNHPQTTAAEIVSTLGISRRTVFRCLKQLVKDHKITKIGQAPHLTYAPPGVVSPIVSGHHEHSEGSRSKDPPLLSLQITNPLTYLKLWWQRVMGNEGVDLHLKIKPLTALGMVALLSGGSFVLGRITLPEPIVQYIPQLAPSPSPSPWREAAYTGKVVLSGKKYYLDTADSGVITLEAPQNVNLPKLLNRRILAIGQYNQFSKILKVTAATDMELLPAQTIPVPTTIPSPSPVPTIEPTL